MNTQQTSQSKPRPFKNKKIALSLPGGGAKGAFQAGVLSRLARHHISYDWIAGISVGALNGALMATGQQEELLRIWQNIKRKDVLLKRTFGKIGFEYLKYKMGITHPPQAMYSNKPMKELLAKKIGMRSFTTPFMCGTVDVESGTYTTYKYAGRDVWKISRPVSDHPHQMQISAGLSARSIMPIVASTAVPVFFDPVLVDGRWTIDGGVRNINPLKDLIQYDPDVIVVIPTEPVAGVPSPIGKQLDILESARRTLDILLNEIFIGDLKECQKINELVLQADDQGIVLKNSKGRVLKYYELVVIDPRESLGSMVDFDRDILDWRFREGEYQARLYLKSIGLV